MASLYLGRAWTDDARQRLAEKLQAPWEQPPADLTIEPVVTLGEPGSVLTAMACQPGDILVIGTGRRGTLAHLFLRLGQPATAWPMRTSPWRQPTHPAAHPLRAMPCGRFQAG